MTVSPRVPFCLSIPPWSWISAVLLWMLWQVWSMSRAASLFCKSPSSLVWQFLFCTSCLLTWNKSRYYLREGTLVVKEGLQYPCDTGGYCVVFYTFTSMSLIFSCCDLITSTSFSRLTSTWSLTLSPAFLPSLASPSPTVQKAKQKKSNTIQKNDTKNTKMRNFKICLFIRLEKGKYLPTNIYLLKWLWMFHFHFFLLFLSSFRYI